MNAHAYAQSIVSDCLSHNPANPSPIGKQDGAGIFICTIILIAGGLVIMPEAI